MSLKQWGVFSVLVCALSSAGVASAADLSVSGHIRPGGACSLALGNGGTFELGTISRKDLKEDEDTYVGPPSLLRISLGVHCQAPTKIALRMLDNRAGTSTSSLAWAFGLGASGGKNVGWYSLWVEQLNGDGKPGLLRQVRKSPESQVWEVPTIGWGWATRVSWLYSWAERGQTLPQAFQDISGELELHTYIAPAKKLDLSQEVAIDGSATVELVYL
ncbi:DUF1120 domain-containing protein [Pseudomonas chlororaphis subsp. aureofaciens]|uniref:DUF1120 domain-containing protein n=1 Tax=Pseudomonas chlororaphis TaxID=587753 RepID=UPI003556451B